MASFKTIKHRIKLGAKKTIKRLPKPTKFSSALIDVVGRSQTSIAYSARMLPITNIIKQDIKRPQDNFERPNSESIKKRILGR